MFKPGGTAMTTSEQREKGRRTMWNDKRDDCTKFVLDPTR